MNFQNVAIECDTWEQMERLAELAEEQGKRTWANVFDKETFPAECYFYANELFYCNCAEGSVTDLSIIPFAQFINQSDTPSVYGC
jgi:hypothetical protein